MATTAHCIIVITCQRHVQSGRKRRRSGAPSALVYIPSSRHSVVTQRPQTDSVVTQRPQTDSVVTQRPQTDSDTVKNDVTIQLKQRPPLSTVLLYKLENKFPAFYKTRKFVTAFTTAYHFSPSWSRLIQSRSSHTISLRFISMLSPIHA
jgi:hypothetical protein